MSLLGAQPAATHLAAKRLFTRERQALRESRGARRTTRFAPCLFSRMVIAFWCNAFSPLRRRSGTSDRSSPIVRAMNSDAASVAAPLAELIRLARLPLAHATDDLARRVSAAARRISTSAWNNPRVLVPSLRAVRFVCASPPLTPLWHTSRIVHCSDLHCCCQTLPRCKKLPFFSCRPVTYPPVPPVKVIIVASVLHETTMRLENRVTGDVTMFSSVVVSFLALCWVFFVVVVRSLALVQHLCKGSRKGSPKSAPSWAIASSVARGLSRARFL